MEDQPFDFNTPITEDIKLIAKFDCPNGVTLTQLKTALDNGTAADNFPVNTQIDDYTNGSYDPWIVGHYGKEYNATHDGVYLYRKYVYPTHMAWGDAATYEESNINTWLNSTYPDECSADIKSMAKQIHVPVVNGHVNAKFFLMSGVETLCLNGSYDAGTAWDSWKQRTGLSGPSTAANDGRRMSEGEFINGHGTDWWLRTVGDTSSLGVAEVTGDGACRISTLPNAHKGLVIACFIPVGDATPQPLTAKEYNDLNITAKEYNNMELTADEYNKDAKGFLG